MIQAPMPLPHIIPTGTEQPEAMENTKSTIFTAALATPVSLSIWHYQDACNPSSCITFTHGPPWGRSRSSKAASAANTCGGLTCRGDNNWNPGAVWQRKRIQKFSTSGTSYRLNPHDQLGRFCVYGIYKWTMRVPTKENILTLSDANRGKNTQE